MDMSNRINQLEDELKVLKNEVLAVLLDVKENLLTRENPLENHSNYHIPAINIHQSSPEPKQESPAGAPEKEMPELPPAKDDFTHESQISEEDEPEDATGFEGQPDESMETRPDETNCEWNKAFDSKHQGDWASGPDISSYLLQPGNGKQWLDEDEESHNNGGQGKAEDVFAQGQISLKMLADLGEWVTETNEQIGAEKTQSILDISEMMGHMPTELKQILENMIVINPDCQEEKISVKVYLMALNKLAFLLQKDQTSEFVVLHMVSQSLNSLTKSE